MASIPSLQSLATTDLSAITSFTHRVATAPARSSETTTPARTSSVVHLSEEGRLLAASSTSLAPLPITTDPSQNTPLVRATQQISEPNLDTLVAGQSASAASIALQTLINDPALRAIANSMFNPVYSALLAAAHQQDFITTPPVTRSSVIQAEIPAPVLQLERIDRISNDNQTAREFVSRQSPVTNRRHGA